MAILVTGGIFLPSTIQTVPAAILMKKWLVESGVPENCVLTEEYSRDTYENVRFGLTVLTKAGYSIENTLIEVVTHWQHSIRLARTVRYYGWRVQNHYLWYWIGIIATIMEFFFIFLHLIDPKGDNILARRNRIKRTYPKTA